jgi:hypothetical protein
MLPASGRCATPYSYEYPMPLRRPEISSRRSAKRPSTPKAANLVKLSVNFLIASVIESLGEAFALVSKGGVDRRQYFSVLTSILLSAAGYKTYGALL